MSDVTALPSRTVRKNHQYSLRVARPLKSAYFVRQAFSASTIGTEHLDFLLLPTAREDRPNCDRSAGGHSSQFEANEATIEPAGFGYLNSVPYLRAISLICSRVSCLGGMPGGLQVSWKKPSNPAGVTIQSRSSSWSGFAKLCQ